MCIRDSRTLMQVLVKHLFPARRVHAGSVCNHTVEVEQNGVILVVRDRKFGFALLLPRQSLSICFAHCVILSVYACLLLTVRLSRSGPSPPIRFRRSRSTLVKT